MDVWVYVEQSRAYTIVSGREEVQSPIISIGSLSQDIMIGDDDLCRRQRVVVFWHKSSDRI